MRAKTADMLTSSAFAGRCGRGSRDHGELIDAISGRRLAHNSRSGAELAESEKPLVGEMRHIRRTHDSGEESVASPAALRLRRALGRLPPSMRRWMRRAAQLMERISLGLRSM